MGDPIIGGPPDYHPMHFPEAMPAIDSGLPDVYKRSHRQEKASAVRHTILNLAGGAALIATATLGFSYTIRSVANPDDSSRFGEYLKPDPLWRVPIGAGEEEILMTDQAGGVKAVDVRLLESRDWVKDTIGTTKPGCAVEVKRVYGPDYSALGEDDGRLPRVIINGISYRTWLVGEFPLYELDGNDRWVPRLDKNGNQIFGKGYISGMNAAWTKDPVIGCVQE